ncbi:MAG: hypothetical protein IJZ35_09030 [Clostridia bacterium]|nr:hypothetical protein [Clostridia bacterium]
MKVFFYELKKIMRPSVLIIMFALYLAVSVTGVFLNAQAMKNGFNPESADDCADFAQFAEVVIADYMLEHYGYAVEGDEIYDFIAYQQAYESNLNKAVSENEYCKKFGVTTAEELSYDPAILGEEYYTFDEDGRALEKIKTDKYSEFFEDAYTMGFTYGGEVYYPPVSGFLLEKADSLQKGLTENGDNYTYYVYNSDVCYVLGYDMYLLLVTAVVCTMITVIPYGITEKRSNVKKMQYSSKTGRNIYFHKTVAVAAASFVILALFMGIAMLYYNYLGAGKYDSTVLNTYYIQDRAYSDSAVYYNGISVSELLKVFMGLTSVVGVCLCLFVNMICSKFRNPITALVSCLPLFAVALVLAKRYISQPVYPLDSKLLFANEGFCVTVVIAAVCVVSVFFDYFRQRKKSV